MIDRHWLSRRVVSIFLLIPGYAVGWIGAQFIPRLFPSLPWLEISPYTIGAIASTIFNTVMWDRFVRLVYRFGGESTTKTPSKFEYDSA